MKENEILEKEKTHLEENEGYRTVHLYLMGTFLRAYDYSAFLVNRFSLKEIKVMHPGGKNDKVFTGFPQQSLDGYFKPEDIETIEKPDENSVNVILNKGLFADTDTADSLSKEYASWHDCVPSSGGSPSKHNNKDFPSYGGVFTILKEILDYPLDRKTPIENITFLSDLKIKITKIL